MGASPWGFQSTFCVIHGLPEQDEAACKLVRHPLRKVYVLKQKHMFSIKNMKFHELSEVLLGSRTAVRVLRELVLFPAREATGRQVAKAARTPLARTIEALSHLERQGLVDMREVGRSHLWHVNTGHTLYAHLRPWFEFEQTSRATLMREIAKVLRPLPFVRRALLFGSLSRGQERPDSDIDLFVLIDDADNQPMLEAALRRLKERLRATFGNPLKWIIYDQHQLEINRNRPFYRNVERDGVILLDRPMVAAEKIDRARAATYWSKAQDFDRTSERAASGGDMNGAALAAIHSVISACDALTAFHLQLRSRDPDHDNVTKLIARLPLPDALSRADVLLEILEEKNVVAYGARTLSPRAVEALLKKASRFLDWAASHLPFK